MIMNREMKYTNMYFFILIMVFSFTFNIVKAEIEVYPNYSVQWIAIDESAYFYGVSWKPDGEYALLVGEADWDGIVYKTDGKEFSELNIGFEVERLYDVAWKPDGSYAIIVGEDFILKYDGKNFSILNENERWNCIIVSWNPDGSYAIIYCEEYYSEYILKYDENNIFLLKNFSPYDLYFYSISWKPDGSYALIRSTRDIWKYDGNNFVKLSKYPGSWADSIGWSPDGSLALTSNGYNIYTYDGLDFLEIYEFPKVGRDYPHFKDIARSPDGTKTLLVGQFGADTAPGYVALFDGEKFYRVQVDYGFNFKKVRWKPDGTIALIVGKGGGIGRFTPARVYSLIVQSDHGSISGGGSYQKDTAVSFSVSPNTVSAGSGVRHIFTGWTSESPGGYTGSDNPAEVVMSNDITEKAEWKTQYYLTMESDERGSVTPSSGWYDAGEQVTIAVKPDSGYSFSSWSGSGSGSYSGSSNSHTITMNGPITETARWGKQHHLSIISPVAVEGEGWYDDDASVTLRVESPKGFLVRKVFKGWSGDIQSESETVTITMDGSKRVVAEWETDYTQLYPPIGVASVAVVSAVVISIQRKRAEDRRRARAELKEKLMEELNRAEAAVRISSLSSEHGAVEGEVRQRMDEALREGLIAGRFTLDNRRFITKALMERMITRVRQADEAMLISMLGDDFNVPEEMVRQLIDEALAEGVLTGSYSKDGKRFITEAALKRIIKDKLGREHGNKS